MFFNLSDLKLRYKYYITYKLHIYIHLSFGSIIKCDKYLWMKNKLDKSGYAVGTAIITFIKKMNRYLRRTFRLSQFD